MYGLQREGAGMSEKLLKMIETVNPEDSAAIEEIEARYICFKMRDVYEGITHDTSTDETPMAKGKNGSSYYFDNYTASRDVLKRERPEGWWFTGQYFYNGNPDPDFTIEWRGCFAGRLKEDNSFSEIHSKFLPTEELAEFHAIIQVITYERSLA